MSKVLEIFKDYFDNKMGMITINKTLQKVENGKHYRYLVGYDCDCGKTGFICPRAAIKMKDCGCRAAVKRWAKRGGHRKAGTPIYQIHQSMLRRCNDARSKQYKSYGGRGIKVCEEWHSFENFYRDMGDKPFGDASIDRIDNDAGYCRENCRWATKEEQANNRRSNVYIEHNGEKLTLAELARKTGIKHQTIISRNGRGADVFMPVQKKSKKKTLLIDGRSITLMEAERIYGIKMKIISKRLRRGWSDIDAVTRPPRDNGHNESR